MRVGLAQVNSVLGDFPTNRERILEFTTRARDKKCDLVVFPELSLFGYLPNDLLERQSIVDRQLAELKKLERQIPAGIAVLVGVITLSSKKIGKPYYNSAALIQKGKKTRFFHKELLPTYDVFDEARHIERGSISGFRFKGKRILLTICEDMWGWKLPNHPSNYLENPLKRFKKGEFDLVINMSASPFTHEKAQDRLAVTGQTAKHLGAPLIYVNMVGGQDEVIFDGGSFAVTPKGRVFAQNVRFAEDLNVVDVVTLEGGMHGVDASPIENTRQALVLGIRDFVRKTGFEKVHLGLSGGIDSAVVACLAVDALGPGRVTCVGMPGPFSAKESLSLAVALAKTLNVRFLEAPIGDAYESTLSQIQESFGAFEFGVVNENLQSRLRGLFLMALSNKENSLLLTTGNKSEYATGYATLYGDMCGGLAPIADLVKSEVYALARHYNEQSEIIPNPIIDRAPSAELRPDQKDEDSLPAYDQLDRAVRNLVEMQKAPGNETERWLLPVLMRTEFKRWQASLILKVSRHAFGRGRRLPIAHKAIY